MAVPLNSTDDPRFLYLVMREVIKGIKITLCITKFYFMKLNYIKTLFVAILVIFATTTNAETYSGTCGTNVKWSLDTETGLLKITGTGAMNNYHLVYSPWYNYKSNIKSVEIGEGITSIGNYAFLNCSGLTSLPIPNSVTSIGIYAFYGCEGLTGVYITDLKAWCNIEFHASDYNPLYYAKKLYLNNIHICFSNGNPCILIHPQAKNGAATNIIIKPLVSNSIKPKILLINNAIIKATILQITCLGVYPNKILDSIFVISPLCE